MLGRGQPGHELRGLAGAQFRTGDLRRLVLLQLETPRQFARVQRQLRERRLVLAPRLHGRRHRGAFALEATEGVEQLPLPALVEEPLLVVLARGSRPGARLRRPDGPP